MAVLCRAVLVLPRCLMAYASCSSLLRFLIFISLCSVEVCIVCFLELTQHFGYCLLDQCVIGPQSCLKALCEVVESFVQQDTKELNTQVLWHSALVSGSVINVRDHFLLFLAALAFLHSHKKPQLTAKKP